MLRYDPPPVDGYIAALRSQPPRTERWHSPHLWARNYRRAQDWLASIAVVIDVDYEIKDEAPPLEVIARLADTARSGRLPGSWFHLTPHGCRVAFVYAEANPDRALQIAAERGAGALFAAALAEHDLFAYRVDTPLLGDLARFFYTPNAIAKGVARNAEVIRLRVEPYTPSQLSAHEPPTEPSPAPAPQRREPSRSLTDAIAAFNADHRPDLPRASGTCPICGHNGCFGRFPDDAERWACWSTNHPDVGVRGDKCYHGDALDLAAHAAGRERIEHLRAENYLPRLYAVRTNASTAAEPAPEPESIPEPRRIWKSRSLLTTVEILRQNARDVLDGRTLELNAMTGRPELGRQPLTDRDLTRIRELIEQRFTGGIDKHGNELGMVQSETDIHRACEHVAAENAYHPVRDYLTRLAWDGVERIAHVPDDILSAPRTELNQTLIRRFLISAVARAMRPGCKLDTVLVLVGNQGCGKSSFFRAISEPWFVDSTVDIKDKDSFQVLRGAWIYEWAELEVLRRAREASAVKAFITSQVDTYRPSYGRMVIDVPRTCVIGGSTNDDEFLVDPTGHRRWWPIRVGTVQLDILSAQRDQLWAEATHAFQAGEPWWLDPDTSARLAAIHEEHAATDSWEDVVIAWADAQTVEFSTSTVLEKAIGKPRGQWARGDEMRVAAVLKKARYEKRRHNPKQPWFWTRRSAR